MEYVKLLLTFFVRWIYIIGIALFIPILALFGYQTSVEVNKVI